MAQNEMKAIEHFTVFESFHGKYIYINSTGNEEWIHSEIATITSDYVLRTLKIL